MKQGNLPSRTWRYTSEQTYKVFLSTNILYHLFIQATVASTTRLGFVVQNHDGHRSSCSAHPAGAMSSSHAVWIWYGMSPKAGAVSWCDGGCDGMRDEGPMSTEHGLAIQTAGTWFRKEKAGSKEGRRRRWPGSQNRMSAKAETVSTGANLGCAKSTVSLSNATSRQSPLLALARVTTRGLVGRLDYKGSAEKVDKSRYSKY
jgi:hypothetical protein